ncbi:MAG: B12-binding domain-containing radical SAM protein [Myxococcales bacterium]
MRVRLVQLPVPPPAALAATGNVPLAAGCLAVAARAAGLRGIDVEVVPPAATDALGDTLLAALCARGEPDLLGLSLYLWNTERSLHLAREVKRLSPRTRIVVGGPEVSADNPFLLGQSGFDLAMTGESEENFAGLLATLVAGGDPATVPGVAVRRPLGLGSFGAAPAAGFPLSRYPSPYVAGDIAVEPSRSIYVETVRGCRSHCTFCFYPRSSSVLRTLDVEASANLVAQLRDQGARQVTFLDPTFNHRPGFVELVDALADVNTPRSVSFFAEVRAEGLTAEHARKLARAGFDKLEIGLQSVNRQTLARVRRGGSPALVAEAARMLHDEGIELLVDLIVGLPGDGPDDVARGVDFLLENGLGGEAQVFPLSLLPGTAMRATAAEDGVVFDPAPPYRVTRTATMSEEQIRAALAQAEERLGRRLDEVPRPHLVEAPGGAGFAAVASRGAQKGDPPDVFHVDLDAPLAPAPPGAQHVALWLEGADLFRSRAAALRAIDARLSVDPHATLDVVLAPRHEFPLDLLELLRARLDSAPSSYASRALAWRGEDLQRRISVVLRGEARADWVDAVRDVVPVFRDQRAATALRDAERLGDDLPGARIVGDPPPPEMVRELARRADPEAICFADRTAEAAWQRDVLGYGDARG